MSEIRNARVSSQLKLALLSDCNCNRTLIELENEARSLGLTGAEIDAALDGRSFAAWTAAAVSIACAVKGEQQAQIDHACERAIRLGFSQNEIDSIIREAKQILSSQTQ